MLSFGKIGLQGLLGSSKIQVFLPISTHVFVSCFDMSKNSGLKLRFLKLGVVFCGGFLVSLIYLTAFERQFIVVASAPNINKIQNSTG